MLHRHVNDKPINMKKRSTDNYSQKKRNWDNSQPKAQPIFVSPIAKHQASNQQLQYSTNRPSHVSIHPYWNRYGTSVPDVNVTTRIDPIGYPVPRPMPKLMTTRIIDPILIPTPKPMPYVNVTTRIDPIGYPVPRTMPDVNMTTRIMDPILFPALKPMPEVKVHSAQTANRRQPVGLINLGTSCFFNAVMQNLNQTFLLRGILEDSNKQICYGPLTKSLLRFYWNMIAGSHHDSQRTVVDPSDLFGNVCKRSNKFSRGQCDSHELLRHLLDGLRIEERQASGFAGNRKMLTNVDRVFGGHLLTVYVCETCQQPYHVCEPMLDISLPIAFMTDGQSKSLFSKAITKYQQAAKCLMEPLSGELRNSRKNKPYSVEDCLGAFTRTEAISNEYLCIACNDERSSKGYTDYRMTSATKRTLVYNPPAILTLHLKRFEQTARGFVKCNDRITFEEMLNLGPYCTSFCKRNEGNEKSIWYSLYGLVVHCGNLDGGHYVAYVKTRTPDAKVRQFLQESYLDRDQLTEENLVEMMKHVHGLHKPNQSEKWQPKPVNGTWFYVSDSHFHEVVEEEVWRQQAYLLFYERLVCPLPKRFL